MCNCFKCVSLDNCDKANQYNTNFEKRMIACRSCSVHSDCEVCKYGKTFNYKDKIIICTNLKAWGCSDAETEV